MSFLDIYPKTYDFSPELFSNDFLKYNPKKFPFSIRISDICSHLPQTISLQPILAMFARIVYILNVSLEKVLVRHD